jgi:hypothetical protein
MEPIFPIFTIFSFICSRGVVRHKKNCSALVMIYFKHWEMLECVYSILANPFSNASPLDFTPLFYFNPTSLA